nr:cytochrome c [Oceanococcus sp. HetDA_MAG_MS8]
MKLFAQLLVVAAMAPMSALAAGDAEAGKAKSATCAACHGAEGVSMTPTFPNLAGQHYTYLVQALKQYREGGRKNAIMSGQAANLSDQDIKDLAAYYAGQDGPLYVPEYNAE